jgi:hypothetical protein
MQSSVLPISKSRISGDLEMHSIVPFRSHVTLFPALLVADDELAFVKWVDED